MTNQRIIYPTDDGGVAIIVPAPEYVAQHGIEAVAAKDVPPLIVRVPTGEFAIDDEGETYELERDVEQPRPYKIINVSDVPTDRTFRAAWEYVE